MTGKRKAAAAGVRHGSKGIEGGESYCPPSRRQTQREKLLAYLRQHGSVTTADARRWLNIMSPASRIMELKRAGYSIVRRYDEHQGCARYHLLVDPDLFGAAG